MSETNQILLYLDYQFRYMYFPQAKTDPPFSKDIINQNVCSFGTCEIYLFLK